MVEGYSPDYFGPEDEITREQLATIYSRYSEIIAKRGALTTWDFSKTPYLDKDQISDWARKGVCWGQASDIIHGTDKNLFEPLGTATRAEAATMAFNYCLYIEKSDK